MIDSALKKLVENNLLSTNAIVVWECDEKEEVAIPESIEMIKERVFGRIRTRIGVKK